MLFIATLTNIRRLLKVGKWIKGTPTSSWKLHGKQFFIITNFYLSKYGNRETNLSHTPLTTHLEYGQPGNSETRAGSLEVHSSRDEEVVGGIERDHESGEKTELNDATWIVK